MLRGSELISLPLFLFQDLRSPSASKIAATLSFNACKSALLSMTILP
jgi:hypothetical protein